LGVPSEDCSSATLEQDLNMKKIVLAAMVSASALSATPALAQSIAGTVNVTGTVSGRCAIIEGNAEKASFTGTIDLGRLDTANGTLIPTLTSSSSITPAAGKTVVARVVCNSANPTIGVSATKLAIAAGGTPTVGYANTIDYVAALRVKTAASTTAEIKFDTLTDTSEKTTQLGGRVLGGTENNVEVNVSSLRTVGGATNILNAGNYASIVSLSITPTI
jgi:hypothetical protein